MNWLAVLLGILIFFAGYGCARFERAALIRHIPFLVEANRDQATLLRRIADVLGLADDSTKPDEMQTGPIDAITPTDAAEDEWRERFGLKPKEASQ